MGRDKILIVVCIGGIGVHEEIDMGRREIFVGNGDII